MLYRNCNKLEDNYCYIITKYFMFYEEHLNSNGITSLIELPSLQLFVLLLESHITRPNALYPPRPWRMVRRESESRIFVL